MAINLAELDAHEQPSDEMRAEWKHISRLDPSVFLHDGGGEGPLIDDPRLPSAETGFSSSAPLTREQIVRAFEHLDSGLGVHACSDAPVLFHRLLPGLLIIPSLIPPPVQTTLLDRMLHRDLGNPQHQTNIHLHYDLPYPEGATVDARSFFALAPDSAAAAFRPRDPAVHKPLSPRQVLQRRLHWLTLGGQYDWTSRVYPDRDPPAFPPDLAAFLGVLFPDTLAQAAIVNLYSPGDTMMMHRDVSERTDRGLVSISLGCDALFMIAPSGNSALSLAGPEGDKSRLLLRLRSGDAIYMTSEARYAWHGVPKVLEGTCPAHLQAWPAREDGSFAEWRGWMRNKRVNLNVRQMRD